MIKRNDCLRGMDSSLEHHHVAICNVLAPQLAVVPCSAEEVLQSNQMEDWDVRVFHHGHRNPRDGLYMWLYCIEACVGFRVFRERISASRYPYSFI